MTASAARRTTRQPLTSSTASASTTRPTPRPDRRTRSLELAEAAGMGAWSVRFRSVDLDPAGAVQRVTVWAPSRSQPDAWHECVYDAAGDSATCACQAAAYGLPCGHAGAAIRYGRVVVACYAAAEEERAAYARHEQNARAHGYGDRPPQAPQVRGGFGLFQGPPLRGLEGPRRWGAPKIAREEV